MSDWTAGYVADIGYTFGYYGELNPLRVRWALLDAGLEPPQGLTADGGAACELGFGQGLSINMHAAASSTQWWGTDFNPAQAAFAQSLAAASQAPVHLFDDAFAEFVRRPELPDFDMIGLHGIWSWISRENRELIVDFVRRKLKVGGVLYISYNSQPGWSAAMPLRHLLARYAESAGSDNQGVVGQIDAALAFAEEFFAAQPRYAKAVPQVLERLKQIKQQDRSYLAHEYFNRDWEPMHFSDVAAALGEAKLSYACSAHMTDHVDAANLTAAQKKLIDANRDVNLRETLRDFSVNQQFRRDLWVKGARPMTPLRQLELMREMRFVLVQPRAKVSLKTNGALGEIELKPEIYGPLLDVLAAAGGPMSFGEIERSLDGRAPPAALKEMLTVLMGTSSVCPARSAEDAARSAATSRQLNQHAMMLARSSANIRYLTSPVLGGGCPVGRFHQLFLLARQGGAQSPQEMADRAWQILKAQNQKLRKDGKTLGTDEENRSQLLADAEVFVAEHLPILATLGVA